MRSALLLLALLFFGANANAQITWDTTRDLSRHEGGYGIFRPSVTASAFYGGHAGLEITRVRNRLSLNWLMSNTTSSYYGIQWSNNPNYRAGLWGVRTGGDVDFRFLHMGLGAMALTDFERLRFYLTAEGGLSWWGAITVYYRYVGIVGNKEFTGHNDYQAGLKYNFTKELAKEFREGTAY
ncbi:MAG: hypothetical protein K0Q66_803 [Chitinophagaceae bacterium]|nr:hypothetical protein [Chitinophagaceae bacterium]